MVRAALEHAIERDLQPRRRAARRLARVDARRRSPPSWPQYVEAPAPSAASARSSTARCGSRRCAARSCARSPSAGSTPTPTSCRRSCATSARPRTARRRRAARRGDRRHHLPPAGHRRPVRPRDRRQAARAPDRGARQGRDDAMSPATAVRAPGVPRTLALALLARVPPSALGLLLVLQVRHLGHSYALAGVCSGACALGMAAFSPLLGRAIDRSGQPLVLTLTGAVVTFAVTAFALHPRRRRPRRVFLLVAAMIGAVQPPISLVRARALAPDAGPRGLQRARHARRVAAGARVPDRPAAPDLAWRPPTGAADRAGRRPAALLGVCSPRCSRCCPRRGASAAREHRATHMLRPARGRRAVVAAASGCCWSSPTADGRRLRRDRAGDRHARRPPRRAAGASGAAVRALGRRQLRRRRALDPRRTPTRQGSRQGDDVAARRSAA